MISIYILALENDKYYVGKSNNIEKRMKQHFTGRGAKWTKLYKPLIIIDIIHNCDDSDEDRYTKLCMIKFGVENVRGGSYCSINLTKNSIKYLEKEILNESTICNIRGKYHFIKDCPNKCNICKKLGHKSKDCPSELDTLLKLLSLGLSFTCSLALIFFLV